MFEYEATRLVPTQQEPYYLPKNITHPWHQIFYTEHSYTSLFHEVSHWCIASLERRQQIDYGYWYQESSRDQHAQQIYLNSEAKTQALEWILCKTVNAKICVIPDNQPQSFEPSLEFKQKIFMALQQYFAKGLPIRAQQLVDALLKQYQCHANFDCSLFSQEEL